MRRLVLLLVALLALGLPAAALADGDPGSDELVSQNLFTGSENVSVPQQIQLDDLLQATAKLGQPVKVAIIGRQSDLGTVTPLWNQPATYSWYLGRELSAIFHGRLVIVMPGGVAYYWSGHTNGHETGVALSDVPRGRTPAQLVAAARAAVTQLETAAGISTSRLNATAQSFAAARATGGTGAAPAGGGGNVDGTAAAARPTQAGTGSSVSSSSTAATSNGSSVSPAIVVVGLIVVLSAVFWVPPLWRRRLSAREGVTASDAHPGSAPSPRTRRIGPLPAGGLMLAGGGIVALVVLAVVLHTNGPNVQDAALAFNPDLDSGTTLTPPKRAANFTLTDETGRRISLSQYRGKVVILSFVDDECQTICPLTNQAMLDAKRSLGPAAKDVQLLAVNANWLSTQVDDVANYTSLHGMSGQWHFLTGSLSQLNRVWTRYGLNEYALDEKEAQRDAKKGITFSFNQIDHVASTFIIDPQGRVRKLYQTYTSYGAIPQFGQVLAQEASRLLPSHPRVHTDLSYATVKGIQPTAPTSLPTVGGAKLALGPKHSHLYVFFDTWNTQSELIREQLDSLNTYARIARREGLPTPVAVDEGSVEPSTRALGDFLKTLPEPLDYPVAVDGTGRVADGYGVQGEPWFVMTGPSGASTWHLEVYTAKWPPMRILLAQARAALKNGTTAAPVSVQLKGSPAPLARLHAQADQVLPGGTPALMARIKALRGHPIVVNTWYSTCAPCEAEAPYFAQASVQEGKQVAFLGADVLDSASNASQFMRQHKLEYPTYMTSIGSLDPLLKTGLGGTPTTIFIDRSGKIRQTIQDSYTTTASLESDIASYLGS